VNDAERLRHDPTMRWIVGGKAAHSNAASPSQMGRFEFQMAEVAIPRQTFQEILRLIAELRPQPHPRQHESFDYHAFKSNRQEECVQMPVKIARWIQKSPNYGLASI
jgi:hypothetical protein